MIALSASSDQRMAAEALRAGAGAYVLKEAAFEELTTAIREVVGGKVYLSPRIAGAVVDAYVRGGGRGRRTGRLWRRCRRARHPSVFAALTGREREVLQLTAEGKSTKQVAMSLGCQRQDRRDPPPKPHGEARPRQRRRPDQVRHPRRPHLTGCVAGLEV